MSMSDKDQATLLEALDLSELPPEEQEALLLDLNSLVFQSSMVRLLEQMDDNTRVALEALIDTNPSEAELEAFIRSHVPQADLAVAETLKEISDDILAAVQH